MATVRASSSDDGSSQVAIGTSGFARKFWTMTSLDAAEAPGDVGDRDEGLDAFLRCLADADQEPVVNGMR